MSVVGSNVQSELNVPIAVASMTGRRRPGEVGDSTERVNRLEIVVRYALYIVITLFLFVPFVMTVLSSFKTSAEVIAFPPTLLPSVWHPENYLNVLTQISGFPRMVFNSFFVTLGFVFIVPRYIMLLNAHLVDTYFAFMVLYFLQPAYILLMTQFFKSIPRDLEEAAIVDGLGWFGIFWKIILPLARPALLATGILTFQGMWNNFLDWVIYMQSPTMQNIQLGLVSFRGQYQNQWNLIMAGSVLAILPILIIYVAGQKYFVGGAATSGMK